jgi:hypothetical protein
MCLHGVDRENFTFVFLSGRLVIELYKSMILPVLFGPESWCLTLSEDRDLKHSRTSAEEYFWI